jgi:(p)ppGpp synthase/HD superfamily hydrolase
MTNKHTYDDEQLLGMAIEMAAGVHWHQKDKGGVSYMLHPLAVMRMVAPDRDLMIVAVLHDALEDEQDPVKRLKIEHSLKAVFPDYILTALKAMTHKPKGEETYEEYIERVAANYLARRVKIADLTHNMDPRRIPAGQIVDKDYARWEKYRRALIRLERED